MDLVQNLKYKSKGHEANNFLYTTGKCRSREGYNGATAKANKACELLAYIGLALSIGN